MPPVEFYRKLNGMNAVFCTCIRIYREQDEDVLSLALFEQVAIKFFNWRKQQKYKLDANSDPETGIHAI